MPNYIFTDKNGTKHSLTEPQLQALAAKGVIVPTTPLETDTGHTGLAGQIPGLKFKNTAPPPFTQPAQATASASNLYCTNCGNPISEHAVACMSCGARPIGHKKFCRHCGVGLNPEQVICIKCGAGISAVSNRGSDVNGTATGETSRTVFVLLAIFLSGLGIHNFYARRKWVLKLPLGVLNILISAATLICLIIGNVNSAQAATYNRFFNNALRDRMGTALVNRNAEMASFYETWANICYFFAFVLFVAHFIWVIRDIACCTTDGDGVPMK